MTKKQFLDELENINYQAEMLQIAYSKLIKKIKKTKFEAIADDLDEAYNYCSEIIETNFSINGYVDEI